MRFLKNILLSLSLLVVFCTPSFAADLSIGCAANFTLAMKELSALYEQETGKTLQLAFGSTGMLYGQIKEGAPYDLFFAADERRPALLYNEGLSGEPQLYALGKVVIWSKDQEFAGLDTWQDVLTSPKVNHVGIANPETAPYGQRATEAMKVAGLLESTTPKLRFGKSVGVAFQYAYSGAADASFVALSQALSVKGSEGSYWPVTEAGPVRQAACVIKGGAEDNAQAFLDWLATPKARTVIERYGYE